MYIFSIFVPDTLLGRLIGAKGSTKRAIEEETGAKIDIPKRGDNGPVSKFLLGVKLSYCFFSLVIVSPSREAVERCYDRIEMIILEGRRRLPFTHFVTIPLESPDFMAKHEAFIDEIRSSSKVDVSLEFFRL